MTRLNHHGFGALALLALVALLTLAAPAVAADPITKEDSVLNAWLEDYTAAGLEARLATLTRDQAEAEVLGWQGALQQILLETVEKEEASDADAVAVLGEEKTRLVAGLEASIAAFEARGGDPEGFNAWLLAAAPKTTTVTPPTEQASKFVMDVKDWIVSADGGIKWATKIILFFLTLIAFKILAGVLGRITKQAVGAMKQSSALLKDFFVNIVKKITFFIGIIMALTMIDVNVGPFVAAMGAVGFIIAFALQGTLSNFASGIMILLYRPYDIGNVVNVAGTTGKVSAMSLVSTTLLTPDNQNVVVPNGSIWGDVITNITGNDTRRVDLVMGIGYDDDIAKAESILTQIVTGHELVLKEPAPVIQVHELADSSVNFVVRPWTKTSDYWTVYWDITRQVKERFDAEGVSIPYPQRDVHMHTVAAE